MHGSPFKGKHFRCKVYIKVYIIEGREIEESRPMAGIVLFAKTLERTSFGHMPMYVIEFVIKLIVICFENNI